MGDIDEEQVLWPSALDNWKLPAALDLPVMQDRGGPEVGRPLWPIGLNPALFPCLSVRIFRRCEAPSSGATAVRSSSCSLGTLVHSSIGPCLKRAHSQPYLLPGGKAAK